MVFWEEHKMSADYGKVVVTDIKIPFGSMVVLKVITDGNGRIDQRSGHYSHGCCAFIGFRSL